MQLTIKKRIFCIFVSINSRSNFPPRLRWTRLPLRVFRKSWADASAKYMTYRVEGIKQKNPGNWVEISPELAAEAKDRERPLG
jgi:hypothetical protein